MFNGLWYECAAGSKIVDGALVQDTPPTTLDIDAWIIQLKADSNIRNDVHHRYVLTRRNYKRFISWAKGQFFFHNATHDQLIEIDYVMFG